METVLSSERSWVCRHTWELEYKRVIVPKMERWTLIDLSKSLLDHTPARLFPRRPRVDVGAIFFSGVQYRGMVQGAAPGMVASVRTGPWWDQEVLGSAESVNLSEPEHWSTVNFRGVRGFWEEACQKGNRDSFTLETETLRGLWGEWTNPTRGPVRWVYA